MGVVPAVPAPICHPVGAVMRRRQPAIERVACKNANT
jgi:hypothetical protein